MSVPFNQGLITVGSGVNFAGYVTNTYLPTELPLLAKTVQDSYQGMLKKHINPAFGNMTLGEMDAATLQRFFSAMPSRGIQYPTMRKNLDALSSVLRSAVRYGVPRQEPLSKTYASLPTSAGGNQSRSHLPGAVPRALLELILEPYATMIFVDVWTGLRISKLCGTEVALN